MAGLTITKVSREHHPIEFGNSEQTIGAVIDLMIRDKLEAGDEVQSIELHLEPEDWQKLRGYTMTSLSPRVKPAGFRK